MSALSIGGPVIRYGEAAALLREMRNDPTTRYFGALNDWDWTASLPEIVMMKHAEAWLNSHIDPKKAKPIEFPMPWGDVQAKASKVTPDELDTIIEKATRRSALRDR